MGEEQQKSKHGIRKTVITALIIYAIVCVTAVSGTLGWFIFNDRVSILTNKDNMHIQVDTGDLMISVMGAGGAYSEWADSVELTAGAVSERAGSSATTITNIDASGDGRIIWEPRYLISEEPPMDYPDDFVDATNEEGFCINVRIKFRTSYTMDVYLGSSSTAYSNDRQNRIVGGTGIAFDRKSLYGDFSCGGICSAVRVAFLEIVDGEEELKCVWIPNDTYELKFNDANLTATYTLTGQSEAKSDKGYRYIYKDENGNMAYHTYTAMEYACGTVIVKTDDLAKAPSKNATTGVTTAPMVNQAVPLLSFVANGTEQEKELLMRVWIEGEDREAHYSLNGGDIGYQVNFVGIQKDEAELEEDAFRYNTVTQKIEYADGTACDGKVVYSRNGIDWSEYGTGLSFPQTEKPSIIYLRTKETGEKRRSNVVTVEIPAKEVPPESTTD